MARKKDRGRSGVSSRKLRTAGNQVIPHKRKDPDPTAVEEVDTSMGNVIKTVDIADNETRSFVKTTSDLNSISFQTVPGQTIRWATGVITTITVQWGLITFRRIGNNIYVLFQLPAGGGLGV